MNEKKTDSNVEKLKFVLPYLLNHNKEHIKDTKRWKKLAEGVKLKEVVIEMEKAIRLSEEINKCFESAIKKLKE